MRSLKRKKINKTVKERKKTERKYVEYLVGKRKWILDENRVLDEETKKMVYRRKETVLNRKLWDCRKEGKFYTDFEERAANAKL